MFGFVAAEQGHIVPLIFPKNGTGGANGAVFSMRAHHHASIIILQGVAASAVTSITVNQCSNFAGANPTAIPFSVYKGETADVDVLGVRIAVSAAGFVPVATGDVFYVIELDGPELDNLSPAYNFVQVVIANGANAVQVSAVALLSGARYAGTQSPTQLS